MGSLAITRKILLSQQAITNKDMVFSFLHFSPAGRHKQRSQNAKWNTPWWPPPAAALAAPESKRERAPAQSLSTDTFNVVPAAPVTSIQPNKSAPCSLAHDDLPPASMPSMAHPPNLPPPLTPPHPASITRRISHTIDVAHYGGCSATTCWIFTAAVKNHEMAIGRLAIHHRPFVMVSAFFQPLLSNTAPSTTSRV